MVVVEVGVVVGDRDAVDVGVVVAVVEVVGVVLVVADVVGVVIWHVSNVPARNRRVIKVMVLAASSQSSVRKYRRLPSAQPSSSALSSWLLCVGPRNS